VFLRPSQVLSQHDNPRGNPLGSRRGNPPPSLPDSRVPSLQGSRPLNRQDGQVVSRPRNPVVSQRAIRAGPLQISLPARLLELRRLHRAVSLPRNQFVSRLHSPPFNQPGNRQHSRLDSPLRSLPDSRPGSRHLNQLDSPQCNPLHSRLQNLQTFHRIDPQGCLRTAHRQRHLENRVASRLHNLPSSHRESRRQLHQTLPVTLLVGRPAPLRDSRLRRLRHFRHHGRLVSRRGLLFYRLPLFQVCGRLLRCQRQSPNADGLHPTHPVSLQVVRPIHQPDGPLPGPVWSR
jgi:hypothetical protein